MSRKKQPKRVRFFLADDIRADGPKPLILGLFADDLVLLESPSEPSNEKPVSIQGITVLASFIDCNGSFDVETSLYKPDGTPVFEALKMDDGVTVTQEGETPMKNINLIFKFSPFTISSLGTYKLDVKLDKKTYSYEFQVLMKN